MITYTNPATFCWIAMEYLRNHMGYKVQVERSMALGGYLLTAGYGEFEGQGTTPKDALIDFAQNIIDKSDLMVAYDPDACGVKAPEAEPSMQIPTFNWGVKSPYSEDMRQAMNDVFSDALEKELKKKTMHERYWGG